MSDADSPSPPDDEEAEYASPPCLLSEVEAAYSGFHHILVGEERDAWLDRERARLIKFRHQLTAEDREIRSMRIADNLKLVFERRASDLRHEVIAAYLPLEGEPDPERWMRELAAQGVPIVLPALSASAAPLTFRQWQADVGPKSNATGISMVAEGAVRTPTIIVTPLIGFDERGYRLAGRDDEYHRALQILMPRPYIVGVGYEETRLRTIFPAVSDQPLHTVATDMRLMEF